jgi:hypothetical protein
LILLWLTLLLGGAPAHAAVPSLSTDEEAALRAHEVLLRTLPERTPGGIRVLGIVDIQASTDAIWAALLDFPGRRLTNTAVKSVEYYKPSTPTDQWVKWNISKFGFDVTYHNHYTLERAAGRLTHDLDPSLPNDLAGSHGVYELHPSPAGAGWTRLAYECESNFGQTLPSFVQRWMSTSGTRDFLSSMADRAEAQAAK